MEMGVLFAGVPVSDFGAAKAGIKRAPSSSFDDAHIYRAVEDHDERAGLATGRCVDHRLAGREVSVRTGTDNAAVHLEQPF